MLLLSLLACLKYEEGRALEGELACELRAACDALEEVGYTDVADCIADATNQDWADCEDYHEAQLQDCLDAWTAAVETSDCTLTASPPAVCAQVCPV